MKNYLELNNELEQLQIDRDNETNDVMIAEIDTHIAEVKKEIAEYDLGDDDLFRCAKCNAVEDIEDSTLENGQYVCC